jgi:tetratricopeptide (TPR) repeat protein
VPFSIIVRYTVNRINEICLAHSNHFLALITTHQTSNNKNMTEDMIHKIDSIVSLFQQQQPSTQHIGILGCLKLIADLCLNQLALQLHQLEDEQHQHQQQWLSYANTQMIHLLNNYNHHQPIVLKIKSIFSNKSQQQTITTTTTLKYGMQRCVLLWQSCIEELLELVRLGDAYMKRGEYYEAGLAYEEASQLLLLCNITSEYGSLHDEYEGLCKLAILGYGHSLFGQEQFEECERQLRLGLHYFPAFPSLPFNPNQFFTPAHYNSLLSKISGSSFVYAFYHYFESPSTGIELFNKLLVDEEVKYFLNSRNLDFSKLSNNNNNNLLDSQFNENQILMEDTSLKQLENWTIRMLDPKNGLDIKTRKYRFKSFDKCFVASEAVNWLSKNGNITRTEAVTFMQRIMDRCVIRHVTDGHLQFKDEYLFFEFQAQLLEHFATTILKHGYLLLSGTVKWNRVYVVLFENAIALFDQKGGQLRSLHRLDKNIVNIVLNQNDNHLFHLSINSVESDGNSNNNTTTATTSFLLKTEVEHERDIWIQSFKSLPHSGIKIRK